MTTVINTENYNQNLTLSTLKPAEAIYINQLNSKSNISRLLRFLVQTHVTAENDIYHVSVSGCQMI